MKHTLSGFFHSLISVLTQRQFIPAIFVLLVSELGCSRDDNPSTPDDYIQVDNQTITLGAEIAAKDTVHISSNTSWNATIIGNADWIKIEPTAGTGDGIMIISTTKQNSDSIAKTTTVRLSTSSGSKAATIQVSQQILEGSVTVSVFGGEGSDSFDDMILTPEGHIIAVGGTHSSQGDISGYKGNVDAWVIKHDVNGKKIWSKTFGTTGPDAARSIVKTPSNNYIIVGTTSSQGWIFCIDGDGRLLWEKLIGGSQNDDLRTIKACPDGNYLISGITASADGNVSANHGSLDGWLVKVDVVGTILWEKSYGGTGEDRFYDATQVADGGFIFSGKTQSTDGDVADGPPGSKDWIGKINANGDVIWSKYLVISQFKSVTIEASNGDYLFGGTTWSGEGYENFHGQPDAYVSRLDSSGNYIWRKAYGGSQHDEGFDLIETSDHYLVLAGLTKSINGDFNAAFGAEDAYLLKLSESGDIIKSKEIGGASYDEAYRVVELGPDRLAFTGYTHSFPHMYPDLAQGDQNSWYVAVEW